LRWESARRNKVDGAQQERLATRAAVDVHGTERLFAMLDAEAHRVDDRERAGPFGPGS
jgi:hypothetical protein